jgi:hypothetical protein
MSLLQSGMPGIAFCKASITCGQRAVNGHPAGGSIIAGASPRADISSWVRRPACGSGAAESSSWGHVFQRLHHLLQACHHFL